MASIREIDSLIESSLSALAGDCLVRRWKAKENDWVNYFVFRYLIEHCRQDGVIRHPAQIAIEVGVPQPAGYKKPSVRRDIVIWRDVGMTCWNESWVPSCHPLAIIEWKVHRPQRKNRRVNHEREWLRSYCLWQPLVAGYAIEVNGTNHPTTITCTRFIGRKETPSWREFRCD